MGARSLPAFTITGSWADTKLFSWKHIHGTHKCPTVCYRLFLSCMLFKQRDGKKRKNLKYTTLQHSKLTLGEKIPPRKIGREEIGCFLAIERGKASGFSICFILILLFVTYEKKKKKKGQLSLWLLWLQVKMMRPQYKLSKELWGMSLHIPSPIWSFEILEGV